jgi:hypothetical protein
MTSLVDIFDKVLDNVPDYNTFLTVDELDSSSKQLANEFKGITLTNPRTNQIAVLPDDIKLVSLGTKLDFLKANGFRIIANRCNLKLRNSAGHLSYKIDANGNVILPSGKVIKIFTDMMAIQDKLRDAAIGGHIAIRHFYYEKYGKYSP